MAELGTLYAVAKSFASLRQAAEEEFLPRLLQFGTRLRRLLRQARLSAAEVERAATEVVELRSHWRAALEQVRASPSYQAALRAWTADDQDRLAEEIPRVFKHMCLLHPVTSLFFPVSPSSGRRRPGASPFLSAGAAAERISHVLANGIEPDSDGADWWDQELQYISATDEPNGLDTPIALQVTPADCHVAVFGGGDDAGLRIFTPCLQTRLTVVLAPEAGDEWWQAYDESYTAFRQRLCAELERRGIRVDT